MFITFLVRSYILIMLLFLIYQVLSGIATELTSKIHSSSFPRPRTHSLVPLMSLIQYRSHCQFYWSWEPFPNLQIMCLHSNILLIKRSLSLSLFFFYFFFFFWCRGWGAASKAYGRSQARGQIGAEAASLQHSILGPGKHLPPTSQLTAMLDL